MSVYCVDDSLESCHRSFLKVTAENCICAMVYMYFYGSMQQPSIIDFELSVTLHAVVITITYWTLRDDTVAILFVDVMKLYLKQTSVAPPIN